MRPVAAAGCGTDLRREPSQRRSPPSGPRYPPSVSSPVRFWPRSGPWWPIKVVANLILVLVENLAFHLAGLLDDNVLAKLLAVMDLDPQVRVPPSEATPEM